MSGAAEEADSSSRRHILRVGAAGIAAVVAAGCGSSSRPLRAQLRRSPPVAATDVQVLNHLLDVEHLGIAAYTAGTPLLDPALGKTASLFLNDELAHAGQLISLVKLAGGKAHKPAPSYDLGHPRTGAEVLALMREVERAQVAAYLDALARLTPGKLRQQVVAMMANDAQHLAVVRAALAEPAVPSAFVTGHE